MLRLILSIISLFLIFGLLLVYIFPFQDFNSGFFQEPDYSFGNSSNMQFYPNMRFQTNNISYAIIDCPLDKSDEVKRAFDIIENNTLLSFYPVNSNPEIIAECSSKVVTEGNTFIAGEGGPTKIVESGIFNIIYQGRILMLKSSDCERPNVAIHEILHALGFIHSNNPNNIMYPTSKCKQTIDLEIINEINRIYSVQSLPDLVIVNSSISVSGVYLDAEVFISNQGIINSSDSLFIISAGEKEIKTYNLDAISPGAGIKLTLNNVPVSKVGDEILLEIQNNFSELDKSNNVVTLRNKK